MRAPFTPEDLEDQRLLQQIVDGDGDGEALEILYARYIKLVSYQARYMLRDRELADDATQEAFLSIWLKAGSYNAEKGKPKSWIMVVARNKVLDFMRKGQRTVATVSIDEGNDDENGEGFAVREIPDNQESLDDQVMINIERERVRKALHVLPLAQLEVICLSFFDGFSYSEIAQKLGQPLGTVKTRIRTAIQKLRAELVESYV